MCARRAYDFKVTTQLTCVTIRDESFETPNFWDLHTRKPSDTTIHPLYTKVTLQGANSYIIILNPKVRLVKDAADVILFVVW